MAGMLQLLRLSAQLGRISISAGRRRCGWLAAEAGGVTDGGMKEPCVTGRQYMSTTGRHIASGIRHAQNSDARTVPLLSGAASVVFAQSRSGMNNPVQHYWQKREWYRVCRVYRRFTKRKARKKMHGHPQLKGVILKTMIKHPKKPNSANRKCVKLRLSDGRVLDAYVPGEGHNLQEHQVVLVKGARNRDLPGVALKVIRGALDCPHVVKKSPGALGK